jgi:3-oxoacyl-[acyl-carrier protein] reductase
MAVNVRAPCLLAQLALPAMIGVGFRADLAGVSSFAAFTGGTCGPHYAASKAALHGLVHYLAPRVADEGVTVNAIALGLIDGHPCAARRSRRPARPAIAYPGRAAGKT